MSLRKKQQINLDTECNTHGTGMDGHSRSSHKYLLLQVWCGLLTAAVVVMAVFLASIKLKVTELDPPGDDAHDDDIPASFLHQDGVSTMKPDNVSPTVNTMVAPLKSVVVSSAHNLLHSIGVFFRILSLIHPADEVSGQSLLARIPQMSLLLPLAARRRHPLHEKEPLLHLRPGHLRQAPEQKSDQISDFEKKWLPR
ncbi:uncharacterized protein LOC118306925 isoform X3 [Scophthalmus maximus]|uniref:uncharacterized protein LOC118306925 isoform X3 n=1 Tax=Scophthalmus maximus TaxID=52904 RepID=UPI001FA8E552|nr:uncharacterized protein LOC118306925 isoform X3 [Scophthalmus maximus]